MEPCSATKRADPLKLNWIGSEPETNVVFASTPPFKTMDDLKPRDDRCLTGQVPICKHFHCS
jgi:hypothetical protein